MSLFTFRNNFWRSRKYISRVSSFIIVCRIYICLLGVTFKLFHVLNFNTAGLMLLKINAHFTFLLILLFFYFSEEFLKKCQKNLRDNFSECLKSRERKARSGADASALPKCKLFTQMIFLKDSIPNRPTTSNVCYCFQTRAKQAVGVYWPRYLFTRINRA